MAYGMGWPGRRGTWLDGYVSDGFLKNEKRNFGGRGVDVTERRLAESE